jgi:hypothetical protein
MLLGMASAMSMATPAEGQEPSSGRICGPSGGVHKRSLHVDVATYEAMVNIKQVTPALIQVKAR